MGWLNNWVEIIKKRPAMYLGNDVSVDSFHLFITGYIASRNDQGLETFDSDETELLNQFTDWLKENKEMEGTMAGWTQIVNVVTESNENSLDKFFSLWYEFQSYRQK